MYRRLLAALAMLAMFSLTAFAQVGVAPAPFLGYQDTYQINVTQNLLTADAIVNIVNAGAHTPTGSFFPGTGYICANVYVFGHQGSPFGTGDPQGEQLQACCACPISRNGSVSLRARELAGNPGTPILATWNAATIKIVFTGPLQGPNLSPAQVNNACLFPNSPVLPTSAPILPGTNLLYGVPPAPANFGGFATGGRAWATHWHAFGTPTVPVNAFGTETAFEKVPLSAAERDVLNQNCQFVRGNGSGFGQCPGCPWYGGARAPERR
jgi:hypothetical protein